MYSMVLMAALTTGADMPDWGRRGWGCCGCYGGYGWGGYGGYGWGGYGGGWGGYGWAGYGGYGGWGGWGGWGGYGSAPVIPSYPPTVIVSNTVPSSSATNRSLYYDPASSTSGMRRATIIVHLPADATLIVDGKPTQATSAVRRFVTPPLEPDQGYHYQFKVERQRDGQTTTTTRRVDVRAGETRQVYVRLPDRDQSLERDRPANRPAERSGLPQPGKTRVPDQP